MKILITGARGFIGKNLTATLDNIRTGKDKSFGISENITIYEYDKESESYLLDQYCEDCDFVFHLAGINRPREQKEYMEGNFGFTSILLDTLKRHDNNCPIMVASSIQAVLDNSYGKSKKAGEDLVFAYGNETGTQVCIYRFPNIFGKWCRPNYNSVVATFCHNVARGIPIQVHDSLTKLNLVYIDDVITELVALLSGKGHKDAQGYYYVPVVHTVSLGTIVDLLYSFKNSRNDISVPDLAKESFVKKLYSTYLSYLPTDQFSYSLKMNTDVRGSFTEILRTADRGQFSVNILKSGVTKGNHWHHTKHEKFVVVSGKGLIQFRKIGSDKIIEYHVSGEKIEAVDIPPGYSHNIINEGNSDLVVFMWSNECFDLQKPDTYFQEVIE